MFHLALLATSTRVIRYYALLGQLLRAYSTMAFIKNACCLFARCFGCHHLDVTEQMVEPVLKVAKRSVVVI